MARGLGIGREKDKEKEKEECDRWGSVKAPMISQHDKIITVRRTGTSLVNNKILDDHPNEYKSFIVTEPVHVF